MRLRELSVGRWVRPLLVTLAAACGGDVRARTVAQAPAAQAAHTPVAKPVWYYHPSHAPSLLARYPLDAQRALYLGRHGDRWLADGSQHSVQVAADMAPKALLAAVPNADHSWSFVAVDGTVYRSATALGAFEHRQPPPVPMVEVTVDKADTLLGVAPGGRLWRSANLGRTWQAVGPAGLRFADVAFARDGTALAFSVPEQHWLSTDQGHSWSPAGPAFGALLLSSQNGEVHAQGVLGRYRWQRPSTSLGAGAGSSGAFEHDPAPAEKLELPFAPPRGPSAAALLAQRAVIVGGDYFELTPAPRESSSNSPASRSWQLYSGSLRGPLQATTLTQPQCDAVEISGYSQWLWLACAQAEGRRETADGDVVELWSSADSGRTWTRVTRVTHASLKLLTFAVGERGRLLLSGTCSEAKRGCLPQGIQYVAAAASSPLGAPVAANLQQSIAPSLAGSAERVLFAPNGRTVYALARSNKNDLLTLFVSRDGGVHFVPKSVAGVSLRRDGSSLGITAASVSDEDSIGIAFSSLPASSARLLWLDAEGRVLGLSAPPKDRVTLAMQGARAVAIDRNGIGVWESRNGGASWVDRPPLPGAVCVPSARSNDCPVDVVCAEAGCVFAESLTRVGWDEPAAMVQQASAVATSDDTAHAEPQRAAIACRLTDPEWQRLGLDASPPTADQAALGGDAWFVVADDASSAEVALWRAPREQAAAVEKRQLLAPLNDATRFAYQASLQVEGAAAIRYRVPNRVGAPIGPVDVAWEDLIHGTSSRSVLPEAGPYQSDDSTKTAAGAERALPALVSITHGGLYLQVHGESVRDQSTFFFDNKGVTRLPDLSWPAGLAGARGEYLHVGQTHQPILFLGSSAVVRAAQHGSSWTFAAHSVGWADPDQYASEQELTLSYWRGRPALQLAWRDSKAATGNAVVLPFQEQGALFGAALEAPTQAHLPVQPPACPATALSETPRVVAQPEWGTRHRVTISDAASSYALLTAAAVLHGTNQQPCVAAYEATTLTERRDELLSALIDTGGPGRAWLFRQMRDASLEYRRMSCEFDTPGAP